MRVKYKIIILLMFICITPITAQRINIANYANKDQIVGIDVSHHTGFIDWENIRKQGIEFAYIKSTEGTNFLDSRFKYNVQKAHEAGIKVGAYHFFRFNQSGKMQAKFYLTNVDVLNLDLPPVLDVEEDSWINTPAYGCQRIITEIKSFVAHIQKSTYRKVMIYANVSSYKRYIEESFGNSNPIWITSIGTQPNIKQWHLWQRCHNGYCKGARKVVDINIFNGDSVRWKNFLTY